MGIPETMYQAMKAFPPTQEHKDAAIQAGIVAAQQLLATEEPIASEAVRELTQHQLPEVAEEVWHQYSTLATSKLVPKELVAQLPPLYSQENEPDPLVRCKFFHPNSHWTWYALEFDGLNTFFGWVYGDFPELGYFTLTELEEVRDPLGMGIERDLYFKPMRLSEVKKLHSAEPPARPRTITIYVVGDDALDDLLTYDPETEERLDITADNPHPIAVYYTLGRFTVRRWTGEAWEDAINADELEEEVAAYVASQFEAIDNDSWFPILKTIAAKAKFSTLTTEQ